MENQIDIFIDRKVVVMGNDDNVLQAARAMADSQVGCIVVSDHNGHISGIVTDRDLVCNLVSLDFDPGTKLHQVMETDVVFLTENSTIEQAVSLMKENGIRRLPIIEESRRKKQRCVGVVTLDDLIAGKFVTIDDLSDIVRSQIKRKKQVPHERPQSQTKIEQTYKKFITSVAAEIGLSEEQTGEVVKFTLSSVVSRLHYTSGAHFVAQLPKKIQDELLDLPAGPDRAITAHSIAQGISLRTGQNLEQSKAIAFRFWQSFRKLVSSESADHTLSQLPDSIRELFSQPIGGSHEFKSELPI